MFEQKGQARSSYGDEKQFQGFMFKQVQCEAPLGGELARGNKHIMFNVKYVYIFKSIIRMEKVLTR
jgi:hypothetical protein